MKKIKLLSIAAIAIAMSACAAPNKSTIGMGVGGVAGGVLGSQVGGGSGRTAAIIGGSLLGAYAGNKIGGQLDELDRMKSQQVLENTPSGKSVTWNNPDSGATYEMAPKQAYRASNGYPCREYSMLVMMDGQNEMVHGTACRNPQGEWVKQ